MNNFTINFIDKNISKLNNLGFTSYNGNNINNEQPIDKYISNKEKNLVLKFKNGSNQTRINIMKYIGNSYVFTKHKYGDINNPQNYRYYINHHNVIKILDRIWYYEIMKNSNNLPNPDIFKISFGFNNNKKSNLILTANNNTLSKDNVLLLDLIQAYDSLEWNIAENLLYHNLKRKMSIFYAIEYVNQYNVILKNRKIIFLNNVINANKGIPTGLPSSIIIFTFIIEEIIIRWMTANNFINNKDFIINIYIDDFYIKILDLSKTKLIISSLIQILNFYKLNINYLKSKIDKSLYVYLDNDIIKSFKELKDIDLYLGIPFTRNTKLYGKIILEELFKKHKLKYNWNIIYNIFLSDQHPDKKLLQGYLNYKLTPLFLNNNNNLLFVINKLRNIENFFNSFKN